LVAEARNMLLSRGCVVVGGVIQPIDDLSAYDPSAVSNLSNSLDQMSISSSLHMKNSHGVYNRTVVEPGQIANPSNLHWQYVSKGDALYCCDELLRVRGLFGPHMYITILQLIDLLPSASLCEILQDKDQPDTTGATTAGAGAGGGANLATNISNNPHEAMIDLEKFLEILYFEFLHQDNTIRLQNNLVFGEYAMNSAVTAVPRAINDTDQVKRPFIIDDDGAGFGGYHIHNLSRIKDILHTLIRYDPMRTGEIDPVLGEKIFIKTLIELDHYPMTMDM
jgi:hypothetical protein